MAEGSVNGGGETENQTDLFLAVLHFHTLKPAPAFPLACDILPFSSIWIQFAAPLAQDATAAQPLQRERVLPYIC